MKHIDGKCPACGSSELALAEEGTTYTTLKVVDGKLVRVENSERMEKEDGEDAVRVFCCECGEEITVPEELRE